MIRSLALLVSLLSAQEEIVINPDTVYLNNAPLKNTVNTDNKFIKELQSYLGVEFTWEGRSKKGLDCMGLVYLAHSKIKKANWKKYPWTAWELIENETLGSPVKGLSGVLKENIDYSLLKEGDIVHILSDSKIHSYWQPLMPNLYAHHMGVYIKEKNWIHANPYFEPSGVIIHSLENFLESDLFKGIYVTRPSPTSSDK